ncbi:hypothetical protein PVAND_017123 [Polypedilum vanderplanki]|uniref:Uncharacterized protein n=1 Tax=Polypedilum vanderplanki TaxID=319348 RepID=A0A9J6BI44_POLVA|nr:hypothetical protein PVAND_017123 [Polypedilum vanderplanki]
MLHIWRESSIHGVKYISDSKNNFIIRLFWFCSFSFSIICLFYYAKQAFIKFKVNPDINLIIRLRPIRDIPFPAVTICSPEPAENIFTSTDITMEELHEFLLSFDEENLSTEELGYLAAMAQACNSNYLSNIFQDRLEVLNLVKGRKNINNNIVKLLDEISFPIRRIFMRCESYHGYRYNCAQVMRRVITDQGFCFTYNLLDYDSIFNANVMSKDFDSYKGEIFSRLIFKNSTNQTQWTLGSGYIENGNIPFRISNRHKFKVDMKFSFDAIYSCGAMNRNYKIIIHLPNEYPTEFHYYKFIESNNANRIIMTAEYYENEPKLRKFSPESRDCYFEGERKLKFFKIYTKSQCNLECLTNHTLKTCNCVKFSMPREQNTPVCNLTQTICYEEARSDWYDMNAENRCKCLQPCTYIHYEVKDEDRMSDGEARLEMSFDEFQIKSHENFVSYQLPNLIAELGGLLGLFMGCSLLSIIELFYFCFASIAYVRNISKSSSNDQNILPTHAMKLRVSELQPKNSNLNNFQKEFNHKVHFSYHM